MEREGSGGIVGKWRVRRTGGNFINFEHSLRRGYFYNPPPLTLFPNHPLPSLTM
ncbi:ALG6, ALG8 glycosyltransferase family-domain-containing protein [Sesbania bispinosa]|nr:ALG6, ALG8 glycosyltransferase family-domain-containing protein [Sesbania bispinosa]